MLGFAFSEAQRSQELMRKIHQQRNVGPSGGRPASVSGISSSSSVPGSATTGSSGGTSNGGASSGEGRKRTRRRRRTRKNSSSNGANGSVGSSSLNGGPPKQVQVNGGGANQSRKSTVGGRASSAKQVHVGSWRAKQHDPPMRKRDLYLSLRCGMVATNADPQGNSAAVGRVTIVNWDNQIVLDAFVNVPPQIVTDYRTEHTGVTAELLAMTSALRFDSARSKVGSLIRGKILIGHGLEVDLNALGLSHPWCDIRDTATYAPFMKQVSDQLTMMMLPRQLDELLFFVFNRGMNPDQPSLVREAIGCLDLYKHSRDRWEKELSHAMQQKERQREMVMNMRASGTQTLSSINENNAVSPSSALVGSLSSSGNRVLYDDYDDSTLASSTLASTDPINITLGSPYCDVCEGRHEDASETSGSFTQNTESESSSYVRFQQEIPSHIENLCDLGGLRISDSASLGSHNAVNTNTAPGSQFQDDNWSRGTSSTSGAAEHSPALWSPVLPGPANDSITSADWSESPHSSLHFAPPEEEKTEIVTPTRELSAFQQRQQNIPTVSLSDEELLDRLPTHLLADIGEKQHRP